MSLRPSYSHIVGLTCSSELELFTAAFSCARYAIRASVVNPISPNIGEIMPSSPTDSQAGSETAAAAATADDSGENEAQNQSSGSPVVLPALQGMAADIAELRALVMAAAAHFEI